MAPNTRLWYRWHWLTWVVGLVVLVGLVARQFEKNTLIGAAHYGLETFDFGWPFANANLVESLEEGSAGPIAEFQWNVSGMFFNGVFCVVSVAAVVFLSERWLRSPRHLQYGLRETLAATTTAAALVAAVTSVWQVPYRDPDPGSLIFSYSWSLINTRDLSPSHWPSVFALACLFYSASLLLIWLLEWLGPFPESGQQQPVPPSGQ